MNIHQFLEHHGISRNPFAEEDAQTDPVFKHHCIENTYHVGWDKIFGEPSDPSTSVVFGEKGAGKTALRLQIGRHVADYNKNHPDKRLFVIHYDDFNPFIDRFRTRWGGRHRRPDKLLAAWQLWDHMDAILSLGVTQLADMVLGTADDGDETFPKDSLRKLNRHQRRDLLLLAAYYDQSVAEPHIIRWQRLRRKLGFNVLQSYLPNVIGWAGTAAMAAAAMAALWSYLTHDRDPAVGENPAAPWLPPYWVFIVVVVIAWIPWLWKCLRRFLLSASIVRRLRVGVRQVNPLRKVLMRITGTDLSGQPFPNKDRTEDRYELLGKLQHILELLGYSGILVLVDRVDEPHLINGSAELMRALLWPLLDNKFLKHPGMGIKLMLPIELSRFVEREDRQFYQRARLDKQNMIPSLQWTGEALFDLANARIKACRRDGAEPNLRELFDESVTDQRLIEGLRTLRVPRHLFKYLYRLLVAHCNAHTDANPVWKISNHMFESVLAVYQRDIEAADRGTGT